MVTGSTNGVLHHLHRAAAFLEVAGLSDGELLEKYVRDRDEASFAGLVHRHGSMVWGVCRRLLGHEADAEDAFQATFLVLVRKAHTVSPRSRVGNWLYGVAHNTALKAEAMNRKRRGKEADHRRPDSAVGRDDSAVAALDEELHRLPEKYRAPIVCCELEGRTIAEAARHLGWPAGTVAGRLARGREQLVKRLTRRGIAPPATALGLGAAATDAPAALYESAIRAATAASFSPAVVTLSEGVLKAMLLAKLKVLGGLTAGAIALAAAGLFAPAAFSSGLPKEPGTPQKPTLKPAERSSTRLDWRERLSIRLLRGEQCFAAAISPDGKRFAVASNANTRVYDAATGKEIVTVVSELTFTAAFSPDGRTLATGHIRSVKLWDVETGAHQVTLDGNGKNVASVAFSPDGKRLAAAEGNGIRIWDTTTRKELHHPQTGDEKAVLYSVAFSPDGKRLVSADGSAKTVTIWDVETGKVRKSLTHNSAAVCAVMAPDAKSLATVEGDGLINWWFMDEDRIQSKIHATAAGRTGLAFSPDGSLLAFADPGNRAVKIWDLANFKEHRTLDTGGPAKSVVFSGDGLTLVTASDDAVRVWEAKK